MTEGSKENETTKTGVESDKEINFLAGVAALKVIYCLITQRKLHSLDKSLQTYAPMANPELVMKAGITVDGVPDEVFAFCSERDFLIGSQFLNKKVARFKDTKFTSICIPPGIFFEALKREDPRVLHINLGGKDARRFGRDRIAEMCRLPSLVKVGQLAGIFLIQDKKKFAVPMEMDGKQYALAFIDEDEAKPTMDGLMADGQQNLQLGYSKVGPTVRGLIGSPFAGLIINPATDIQLILSQDDLVRLEAVIQALKGPSLFSKETFKEIFSLHRR